MPITLNHSNISVQYSTGSNYIIETVKSDLYRRNELIDTIVRDNIQVAPVTPSMYIENGTNNIYAVESYTYSGSANTADFTRVFTKSTTCDILIVGGGGAGAGTIGGGGGAGSLIFAKNATLNGTYTINVGKGGIGGLTGQGTKGNSSSISKDGINITAEGGGASGRTDGNQNGGSGGGGDYWEGNQTRGTSTSYTSTAFGATIVKYGNNGANAYTSSPFNGGGGGGAGGSALIATSTNLFSNGGSGLHQVIIGVETINFATIFGINTSVVGGVLSNGNLYYAGGGGSGGNESSLGGTGGIGGGGNGGPGVVTGGANIPIHGSNGLPNTGGGGGGGSNHPSLGGNGGSGIVIIRYLLGTIPTNNLLTNEPTVVAPTFTENVTTFTHSGTTENQTTHTITLGQNAMCDILMIGGGGGGGVDRAGGGGSGALILSIGNILSGTYTIKVGNGGTGAVYTSASAPGQNGFDCEILNSAGTVIFRAKGGGGGQSLSNDVATSGGSGGGASSQNMNGGLGGIPVSTNIVNGITTGPVVTTTYGVYGNRGGRNITPYTGGYDNLDGAGGGGIGEGGSGSGSLVSVDSQFVTNNGGKGGDGLYFATINGVTYNFKNNFNVNGVQDGTTGNFFIGGGGGGGDTNSGTPGIGGKGGGGAGGDLDQNGFIASGFGSGGGGAGGRSGGNQRDGGKGSAGIVAIKFRTIISSAIMDGITHKALNFANEITKYAEYLAQQKTGVGGWRIVRFLPPNIGRWYQGDYINTSTFNIPTIGTSYNYTNEWAVPFGTFDEMFFATFDMTYWLYCLKTSVLGNYSNAERPIIKSSFSSTPYSALWFNRATGGQEDPWIRIIQEDNSSIVYGENNNTDHPSLRNAYGGMCVLVRDSTSSTTISNPNLYTLNFQVPTIADINNNSNIVLRGEYDIALNSANAVIIPKAGQYIPKPTTFTNYTVERMYPPVRNFTAATTAVSGQTYGNGTYVVSSTSTYAGSEPFRCFNTSDTVGGHWNENRYTSGVFNSTSFIVAGYLGDWVKIQLPVAIKLTRFNFVSRPTLQVRSPKDFKIYGSNDNITWVELVNKTDAVYNASSIYEQTTPEITSLYIYYGLVVNKIFTGSNDNTLNFDEWYIYGQEASTSSLSLRYHLLNPILDPIGAQWTYSSNNTNVYHMGSVGIGTTSPEYSLDVRGAIYSSVGGYTQTGLTTWSITSDRRIKENITRASYDICLENVKNIELYNFNFKNNCVNTNDKHQLGFIAQEVQQVYPKAVEVGKMILNTNEAIDDILTLNTTQIDYTLYGAVKNLIEKIEDIDNDLENIEKLI